MKKPFVVIKNVFCTITVIWSSIMLIEYLLVLIPIELNHFFFEIFDFFRNMCSHFIHIYKNACSRIDSTHSLNLFILHNFYFNILIFLNEFFRHRKLIFLWERYTFVLISRLVFAQFANTTSWDSYPFAQQKSSPKAAFVPPKC